MNIDVKSNDLPTRGIWRRFFVLVPMIIVMVLVCRAYIQSVGGTYEAWTPVFQSTDFGAYELKDVHVSDPAVVEATSLTHGAQGAACVTLHALSDGSADVTLGDDETGAYWYVDVRDGTIVEGEVDFSGWESIHICIIIGLAVLSVLFLSVVARLVRVSWYGYEMVACGGGALFALFQLAIFLYTYVRRSMLGFGDLAYQITEAASWFVMISLLPMAILAIMVSLSNIWLIRHEGRRPVNLLGIAVSVVWAAVNFLWLRWWSLGDEWGWSFEALQLVDSVLSVGITFGECLLLSTIVCAWLASRHTPKEGKDYLVILGCGIFADGTPSPLLAGRVDRARAFDEARVKAGDAPATFVPSGGQGPDECMSEAQSMRNYLVGKGVDPNRIVLEPKSATTRENMAFSREVIEEHAGCDASELSVGFSTTNYHVFRGYVCAHEAGMSVEGMGSRTRAYFWPNAFLREFAGLLVAQWKSILQIYLLLAIIYAFAEYALVLS